MRRWWRRCAGQSSREELFPFGVGRAGDESAGGGGPVGGRRVAWGVSNEFDRGACGWRSACAPNEFGLGGLRPTVGLRRPGRCLLRRRRPTPGAQRLGRPISIGVKAFGRRSACAPNEFGLGRPSADGRPAPTGKAVFCVGEGRRPARERLGRPISIGRSGFSRDHGGIEKREVAVRKALPPEMIAAAIGTLSPESEGAGRKKAPRGAERDPGRLPPASPRWGRAAGCVPKS
jgi:hypothetical protein